MTRQPLLKAELDETLTSELWSGLTLRAERYSDRIINWLFHLFAGWKGMAQEIAEAWPRNNAEVLPGSLAIKLVDKANIREVMHVMADGYQEGAITAELELGLMAIQTVPDVVRTVLQGAEVWAGRQAADLVSNITSQQMNGLRATILDSLNLGEGINELASRIEQMRIGLTVPQGAAARNYERQLLSQGVVPGAARRSAARYAETMAKMRARTIARTESMFALNMGRMILWEEMMKAGKLDPGTNKRWVTALDERTCQWCVPLDGTVIPMTSTFESNSRYGDVLQPPLHVACRCVVILTDQEAGQ